MVTTQTVYSRLLPNLRTIRQLAEVRNGSERLRDVVGVLRRISLARARIGELQTMRFHSEAVNQADSLLAKTIEELLTDPSGLVRQVSELTARSERIRTLEATACRDLSERVQSYVDLSRKFQLQVSASELQELVRQFMEYQVQEGELRPQLEALGVLATRMRALYQEATSRVLGHLKAVFGPNVDMTVVRQLMGDGVPASSLRISQLQRLLRSKLAPSLIIRLK
ncbi:MAG: hypothetical protein ACOY94_20700 [Bacillota bacterium]